MVQLVSNSCENRHSRERALEDWLYQVSHQYPLSLYFPDGAVRLLWSVASESQLRCKNVRSVCSAGLSPSSSNTLQGNPFVKDVQRGKCMHDQPTRKIRNTFQALISI